MKTATVSFGHQQVATLVLDMGMFVTVHLHGLDAARKDTVHCVELHVDNDGIARVVVDDRSIVHTHKEIYGT